MSKQYDIAIIGGGIMGCGTALQVAKGGIRPIIIEQNGLGQGASGVNAGTLSLQIKRVKLMPYALEGHAEWKRMGEAVGFHETGGYTLAFNDREAELLHERMGLKRQAGAPIEFVDPAKVGLAEPNLGKKIVAASYCPSDGYANSSLTGQYYRQQLKNLHIPWLEQSPVDRIERLQNGFNIHAGKEVIFASRILMATGGWLRETGKLLDIDLDVTARINTVSVTERAPKLLNSVIGHATGLLTMKQKENGTILIGGGWQGLGKPQDGRGTVTVGTLLPNLQLAQYVLPELQKIRLVRSWTGFEAHVPDFYPLAGRVPGEENIFVLGCVRGGYTIGPYISRLMGDFILGKETAMPLFDPGRKFDRKNEK